MPQDFQKEYPAPPLRLTMPDYYTATPYYQPWLEPQQYAPPLPPKEPIYVYSDPYSPSSAESAPSLYPPLSPHSQTISRSPIEPDQPSPYLRTESRSPTGPASLSPHSQTDPSSPSRSPAALSPQALTQPQSPTSLPSQPKGPFHITANEIYSAATGFTQYTITRESNYMPAFLSTKPVLTIRRASDSQLIGQLRFHSLKSRSIQMTVNGRRETSLSRPRGSPRERLWEFCPASAASHNGETWYWRKDSGNPDGTVLQRGSNHKSFSVVLARMDGDVLTFETEDLSEAAYDEAVLSAVAVAEAARRAGRGMEKWV
ncbi:hypothetical protein LTR08_001398 [Meristemomyces frigidus]|nr:hypothetical protein LTR08_001398 [Meristemomyces frigidus]